MTFSDGDYRVWLITGASSGLGRALADIPARPSRPAWT
jgi:NAD(P)-dependent dehydrogenase (short-subunit alcohol dehydrogenase family)